MDVSNNEGQALPSPPGDETISLHQKLQTLIRLSTWELDACLSRREIREHGPDDFFQIIYSAFTIYLDWNQIARTTDISSLAKCLLDQDEVKEFMPRNTVPDQLLFTIVFAAYLSTFWRRQDNENKHSLKARWCVDEGELFLDLWEEHVYPILRALENQSWAEMWRGGHITNGTT